MRAQVPACWKRQGLPKPLQLFPRTTAESTHCLADSATVEAIVARCEALQVLTIFYLFSSSARHDFPLIFHQYYTRFLLIFHQCLIFPL